METEVHRQSTVSIRRATSGDVKLLQDVGIQTFHDTFADVNTKADMDQYLDKNFNPAQITQELADADNVFFIAESNGQPAGYSKLRKGTTPPELQGVHAIELERLYVAKEFLGKRVGLALMDRCLSEAREEGFNTVWLGVWENNGRAIAFYEKCGFEKFGVHPFMLGTDLQTDNMMKKGI
jgi:ribosomal protein S18 acetylase RimI-like enzyme